MSEWTIANSIALLNVGYEVITGPIYWASCSPLTYHCTGTNIYTQATTFTLNQLSKEVYTVQVTNTDSPSLCLNNWYGTPKVNLWNCTQHNNWSISLQMLDNGYYLNWNGVGQQLTLTSSCGLTDWECYSWQFYFIKPIRLHVGNYTNFWASCDTTSLLCVGTNSSLQATYFNVISLANGNYQLQVINTDFCLNVWGATDTNQVDKVNLWYCLPDVNCQWTVNLATSYNKTSQFNPSNGYRNLLWNGAGQQLTLTNTSTCSSSEWQCNSWRFIY